MKNTQHLSRRSFLRQARNLSLGMGAVLAGPNIFLNETRAATGENPSELVRVGFIATGGRGVQNMGYFLKKKNVAAVCDVDATNLANGQKAVVKAQGKEVPAYRDYRKLLEDKSVDAVVISTPDHWHALQAIHACQAGKDVYCEKPLTLFIEEGKAMVKAVRQYKRVLQTGSQQRSDQRFRTAVEMVRSGKIGKLHTVKVGITTVNWDNKLDDVKDSDPPPELDYDMWLGPAPYRPYNRARVHYFFRFFWDYSGGQMTNWGAHHLDIAHWGMDVDHTGPVEITGQARYDEKKRFEVPVWSLIHYKYPNGVQVILEQGAKMGTTFIGDKGVIYVNRGVLKMGATEKEEDLDDIPPMKDADIKLVYISNDHYGNWLECIKTRKDPICSVEIGHRTATACHLGNIAARTGKKITWDPVKEVITDPSLAHWATKEYRPPWKLPV
ncbi:Gfo/Idh/MocA family oxidoreductase [Fontisphaera persica]|uniref:Gfo/Idh/MocA family protein n=1 Tax=Fontisphaera persica TaxID=2974023 RepID=UPI0024C0924F|nr:Gfo/Idh/MocA family oxidoreductase [Fontisphaera persica]WCJ59522.1 Gfo/Idh/MocA family oxidoreductase [Fontisphaera persica]